MFVHHRHRDETEPQGRQGDGLLVLIGMYGRVLRLHDLGHRLVGPGGEQIVDVDDPLQAALRIGHEDGLGAFEVPPAQVVQHRGGAVAGLCPRHPAGHVGARGLVRPGLKSRPKGLHGSHAPRPSLIVPVTSGFRRAASCFA